MENLTDVKLEIFVPQEYALKIRDELAKIGVGVIGNYDHCVAMTAVRGFFRPLQGADPFEGEVGNISEVAEYKVEVNCKRDSVEEAIKVIRSVHPYEEPLNPEVVVDTERETVEESLGKILAIAGQPVEAESETAEPGQPGLVWSYSVSEGSFGRPVLSPDGTIYLLMAEEKKLHILGPDGQLRATLDLEAGPYTPPAGFGLGSSDFSPVALPDGTLLVLSETNSVFAVSPQGSLLWEATLEAEPAHSPRVDGQGRMYLTDSQAGLYTFDSSGLLWRFQSEAAPSSANGLAAGPDGSFYYVVTNRSMGIIQAVSSAGQALWATQVKTSNFYDELQVSPDGQLIALDDDLFDAQTGERLAFELPVQVDEYIFGEDGGTYLRSVHTVMALRQGPGGIEIFNSAAMGGGNIVSRPPEEAQVDRNGVIWLYYRENLVWLSQDGQVLGTQNPGWGPGVFITEDYTQSRLVNCHHFLESETLECLAYAPGSDKPVWKIAIPGIPFFIFGSLDGNMAFLSDGSRLQKVYLGEIE